MVRPVSLYNKARFSRDFEALGRVIAVLCGNAHITRFELTDSELSSLEELENENDEMDKAMAKEQERKAKYRAAKTAKGQDGRGEMSQGQNAPSEMSQGQNGRAVASAPNDTNDTNSTNSTNDTNSTSINRTDADTHARTCAREAARSASASGSGRLKFNVYEMEDGEFFDGSHNVLDLYRAACGNGFWAKAVRAVGEAAALEELNTFVHEVRAGERVDNPGAVMSKRLRLLAESKGAKIA